ncbi:thioredoxin family protein [Colwelliaceae bacterium BS250]
MTKALFQPLLASLFLVLLSTSFNSQAEQQLPTFSKEYNEQSDPFKDASAAIQMASQSKRNVLIEIGGNWCTWCHKMDAFLEKNPDIYQALHENFVLLKVSVSDTNENEAFMQGLPPVLGYPHMYVSTAKGKVLLSKDTADFLTSGNYSRTAWLSFIEQWSFTNNATNLATQAAMTANKNNASADVKDNSTNSKS